MRAEQARAQRRRRLVLALTAVSAVVLVIAGLVVAKVAGVGSHTTSTTAAAPAGASPQVVSAVTSVPAATLDKVGAGTAGNPPAAVKAPALTADGKPKMLYVGAEYCPFCAAQRWGVMVALSRFGTWSNLGATTSSASDVYPNTPTLSFHGAGYTSKYVTFAGYETQTNTASNGQYAPLDTLPPADQQLLSTYDQPPYVASDAAGSIPFLDIAGQYIGSGASYSPQMLAGKTREQIASRLANPADPIAQAVDGTANLITAAVCKTTGGQPANVCTAPGVTAAAGKLGKSS